MTKDEQLLGFFEMHKNGEVRIEHKWNEKDVSTESITLEDFYRMFDLVKEKRDNAVHQD